MQRSRTSSNQTKSQRGEGRWAQNLTLTKKVSEIDTCVQVREKHFLQYSVGGIQTPGKVLCPEIVSQKKNQPSKISCLFIRPLFVLDWYFLSFCVFCLFCFDINLGVLFDIFEKQIQINIEIGKEINRQIEHEVGWAEKWRCGKIQKESEEGKAFDQHILIKYIKN